jgi:serine/threonine-protein kinase ULK/ATG1
MYIKIGTYIYTKKKYIGSGSFAKVYKGQNIITKQIVAIKVIYKNKLNKQINSKIDLEIKVLKENNNHNNIVKLIDVLYSDDLKYVYIIMEYCENGDLSTYIKNNKLNEEQVKYYMIQLKNGLEYLRNNNIIHRDLKPANILLTQNYKILKIADFGLAKNIHDYSELMDTLCGSPLYMAPELINNKKYNLQSDLWSIGIILYEMLYHKHPYGNPQNIIELIDKINNHVIIFDNINLTDDAIKLVKMLLINPYWWIYKCKSFIRYCMLRVGV